MVTSGDTWAALGRERTKQREGILEKKTSRDARHEYRTEQDMSRLARHFRHGGIIHIGQASAIIVPIHNKKMF